MCCGNGKGGGRGRGRSRRRIINKELKEREIEKQDKKDKPKRV